MRGDHKSTKQNECLVVGFYFLIDIKKIYMEMHSEKLFLCGKCVSYSCYRPYFLIIRYTSRKNIWINLFINIFQVCRIFMKKDFLHVERN